MHLVVFILSFSIAVVVSAACSIAESVLLSLSTAQLVELNKKNPKIGKIWEDFKKNVNAPVTAILTLNTTAHTVGAALAGASFAELTNDKWVGIFSLVFTFIMLQFTEILPKTLGVRYNRSLALVIAHPLSWLTYLSAPLFHFFMIMNRPFEPKKDQEADSQMSAVHEIMLLTSLARSRSQLDVEQEKIILATLRLSTTLAQDVMVPISDVSMFSDTMPISEALEVGKKDSHTRFPIYYNDDRSFIIGYVNLKELIGQDEWSTKDDQASGVECLEKVRRNIVHVEPTAKASDVLNILVKHHEHIALVIDSANQKNLGILTLEDLVEELVGEIEDEFDRLPEMLQSTSLYIRVGGGAKTSWVKQSVEKVFPNEAKDLLDALGKADPNQRFTNWFEEILPVDLYRNARLDFGPLSVWIRRVRRDQVFDAQIQRSESMDPRIVATSLASERTFDSSESAVGF